MLTLLLISLAAAGAEIGAPPRASSSWAPTLSLSLRPHAWYQGPAGALASRLRSAPPLAESRRRAGGATIICGIPVLKADSGYDAAIERKAPAGLDPKIAREFRCRE